MVVAVFLQLQILQNNNITRSFSLKLRNFHSMEIRIRGSLKFMKFYSSVPKTSDLYVEIDGALALLKEDCEHGNKIPKDRWPKCYIQNFNIQNLYRFELRDGRRLIYTIYSVSDITYCNILEYFQNHKEYEKRFGY